MAQEIERKFLLKDDAWRGLAPAVLFRQGYLSSQPERIVRVRVVAAEAWLTIKGLSDGLARAEYEYPIPHADAVEMLDGLCETPLIEKRRSQVPHAGLVWEIDEFLGENTGLIVAEVELQSPQQPISLPPWIGREVTGEARYYNSNLLAHPYQRWAQD